MFSCMTYVLGMCFVWIESFMWQIWISVHPVTKLSSKWWHKSRVSCQKGPTRHAYAWLIGPFWQDTLDIWTTVPTISPRMSEPYIPVLYFSFFLPRFRTLPQLWTAKNANHDDVIKWKHFPCYWPFVRGIHRSPVNSPHKGQWRGALMFSLIYARINGWVNNREAGDLRHHRTHHDVIVMWYRVRYHSLIITRSNFSEILAILKIFFVNNCHFGQASTY